ncbi:MAG: hypothetical protein Q9227_007916 [Pyrenula ochraceoflavens]
MASGPHTFVTYDVFTAERYRGNPLAIVAVRGNTLSQEKKQKIAKEFNYSETVFLYDAEPESTSSDEQNARKGQRRRKIEIFLRDREIPFAGHPVIGTAHYIFQFLEPPIPYRPSRENGANERQTSTLLTKAGPVTIHFNPFRQVAAASVPLDPSSDIHVHATTITCSQILAVQPQLSTATTPEAELAKLKEREHPVVSIVKGMNFALIDLTGCPGMMAGLKAGEAPTVGKLDEGWNYSSPSSSKDGGDVDDDDDDNDDDKGFVGTLYFTRLPPEDTADPPIHRLEARMIEGGMEDAATGSGCCALAGWLAEGELGKGHHVFAIQQGKRMGRESQICVEVEVEEEGEGKGEGGIGGEKEGEEEKKGRKEKKKKGKVKGMMLSGRAIIVMKGELMHVY